MWRIYVDDQFKEIRFIGPMLNGARLVPSPWMGHFFTEHLARMLAIHVSAPPPGALGVTLIFSVL